MFGISIEHLLILGVILLIFGPKRLPELGNTMGKALRNFKDALSGVEEAKFRRIEDEKPPVQPAHATPPGAATIAAGSATVAPTSTAAADLTHPESKIESKS